MLVFPPSSLFAVSVRVPSAVIFGPYERMLSEYALQDSVMWQPTLGMIIYAQVSIFHSTAKV